MRIPITMCHGVEREAQGRAPLTAERFDALMVIAHRLETETNGWKCGRAATMPQTLDPFGLPLAAPR